MLRSEAVARSGQRGYVISDRCNSHNQTADNTAATTDNFCCSNINKSRDCGKSDSLYNNYNDQYSNDNLRSNLKLKRCKPNFSHDLNTIVEGQINQNHPSSSKFHQQTKTPPQSVPTFQSRSHLTRCQNMLSSTESYRHGSIQTAAISLPELLHKPYLNTFINGCHNHQQQQQRQQLQQQRNFNNITARHFKEGSAKIQSTKKITLTNSNQITGLAPGQRLRLEVAATGISKDHIIYNAQLDVEKGLQKSSNPDLQGPKVDPNKPTRRSNYDYKQDIVLKAIQKDKCGEDAYFHTDLCNGKFYYMGVADGVGGWQDMGINPAIFSWKLMNYCNSIAMSKYSKPDSQEEKGNGVGVGVGLESEMIEPKVLLNSAYRQVVDDPDVKAGSSTACLASFDTSTGRLQYANLGDSGLIVVRDSQVCYQTKDQQHFFNAPYQLAQIKAIPESQRGYSITNEPSDAVSNIILDIHPGDVIILTTDGLLDNVYHKELAEVIAENKDMSAMKIARKLVELTIKLSLDEKRKSPFCISAKKHGYKIVGGKIDDVCVLVAKVMAHQAENANL